MNILRNNDIILIEMHIMNTFSCHPDEEVVKFSCQNYIKQFRNAFAFSVKSPKYKAFSLHSFSNRMNKIKAKHRTLFNGCIHTLVHLSQVNCMYVILCIMVEHWKMPWRHKWNKNKLQANENLHMFNVWCDWA